MSKETKQSAAWAAWTSDLTDAARKALQVKETEPVIPVSPVKKLDDEETDAYHNFRLTLSAAAREWLDSNVDAAAPKPDDDIDPSVMRYGIVEGPDGDWPMMRLYKSPEALARRIGQLVGEDVVVWGFVGLPVQITKGEQRYLLLPGGQAISIPLVEGGPVKMVSSDLLEGLEIQDDGFMGPPELASSNVIAAKLEPAKVQKPSDDDEDDDEDPSDAGVE